MALGLYQQQCGHRPRAVPIFLCWALVMPHLGSVLGHSEIDTVELECV